MDREWTYRPPVLVGERVVWLGRSAGLVIGECCEYGPHHGIVSWIGRVPEMGNHWTVGVEFVSYYKAFDNAQGILIRLVRVQCQ